MSLKFKGNKSVNDILKTKKKVISKEYRHLQPLEVDPFSDNVQEKKTPTELSFQITRKNRVTNRVEKSLDKNYKGKVMSFNKSLSKLPMHFDIPKIGPG